MRPKHGTVRRKQFAIDTGVLLALENFARDSKASTDALVNEALRDLLKKHRRPLSLKQALQESARELPANDPAPTPPTRKSQPKLTQKRSARKA